MSVAKNLTQKVKLGFDLHPFGYPSKHLADNACCNWFDNGEISFYQWELVDIIPHEGKYYVSLPE